MTILTSPSEIWIVQNLRFTEFEVYHGCHGNIDFDKNNASCRILIQSHGYKFHNDETKGRFFTTRLKKLGMVLKKLHRNTLDTLYSIHTSGKSGIICSFTDLKVSFSFH